MKILFQGDSITDFHRDRSNPHDMGPGYPKFVAEAIVNAHPDTSFEFWNFGIIGNRTSQVLDRLEAQGIEQQPDIFSILIGINDISVITSEEENKSIGLTPEQFLANYRTILTKVRTQTNAKILMLSPFLLDHSDADRLRDLFCSMLPEIKKLADEMADAYVPLNEVFAKALAEQPHPLYYSGDGVHPYENGVKLIAQNYLKAVEPLIEQLSNNNK